MGSNQSKSFIMLYSQPDSSRQGIAQLIFLVLVASVLLTSTVTAQPAPVVTFQDIAVRDRLVADQETLLNMYRCVFQADTDAVPGGCNGTSPARGATVPGSFEGSPTMADLKTRDHLIAAQETLLNTYRCQFSVDTRLVPGGCTAQPLNPSTPAITLAPTPTSVVEPTPISGLSAADIAAAEHAMLVLVNDLRASVGADMLLHLPSLGAVARAWSQTMSQTGDFEHNPDYLAQYPGGWRAAGENISYSRGYEFSEAVQVAFNGLVDSPGHYQNMVDPDFTHLGVGIAVGENGSFYLTQNFAAY